MNPLTYYYPSGHQAHFEPGHPERPERVEAIRTRLLADRLWPEENILGPLALTNEVLHAIHDSSYLEQMAALSRRGGRSDEDTYLTPTSYELALATAGGAAAVAQAVWLREYATGFALCRPPGHHATRDQAMGFCILNNVALAAQHLIQVQGARRLAILDIDLHHGNGTQDIFYSRADVFFASIHQSPLYPGSGAVHERGQGSGEGHTLNFPLLPYAGDEARNTFLQDVLLPLLERFEPEMLLVSAGLDAHWRDPLGHQVATANGYASIIATLRQWSAVNCNGRLALFLEGGYDLDADAECGAAIAHALLGQPWEDRLGSGPNPEKPFWKPTLEEVKTLWGI